MKIKLFDLKSQSLGEISLPSSVFESKISLSLIAQAVRVYLHNQRKARAKAKSRSEVRGTTKKMWAQKGTGRARHGSAKAPIFVGGGVAQGPSGKQNYKLKLSKTMRRKALRSLLSQFALEKNIISIDKLSSLVPKTKTAANLIKNLRQKDENLAKSKKIAIITSAPKAKVKRAFSNLPFVTLLNLKSLSVYALSRQNFLIFSPKAIKLLSKNES
ncbi:50S ribosomal protein L4 [Patescibacteria group bacterium]|nr:50S ribosomal protein L4 [Patescibacteria group bacterium]